MTGKKGNIMNKSPEAGKCHELVERRVSRGIMGKGTESFRGQWAWCSRNAAEGDTLCSQHRAKADRVKAQLEARKARA